MVDFRSRETTCGGTTSNDSASGERRRVATEDGESVADDTVDTASTAVSTAVVTVSASRTHENDPGGDAVVDSLDAVGHDIATREMLRPTHDSVQQTVDTLIERDDVDIVITAGGTGVTQDDVTVDAVDPLLDRSLPGFGEQFRRLYAESVGTDVVATRAMAGIAATTPVFCLPGDPAAARIGVENIVVEQASRLVGLATLDTPSDP